MRPLLVVRWSSELREVTGNGQRRTNNPLRPKMSATIDAVPPTREFTVAWVAYALFAIGIFLW